MHGLTIGRTQLMFPYCWVCGVRFKTSVPPGPAIRNAHHIFPTNAGGADGPLVSLCNLHHVTLHHIAKRIQAEKDYRDLLTGESAEHTKKLLWLAQMVVKAEAAVEDDPNKQLGVGFKFSTEEVAAIDALRQRYGNVSRKDLVLMGLKLLARQK